jgi:hypothetical protein
VSENADVERINGVLKLRLGTSKYNLDLKVMKQIVTELVTVYNQLRPYYSNYIFTPNKMPLQWQINPQTLDLHYLLRQINNHLQSWLCTRYTVPTPS